MIRNSHVDENMLQLLLLRIKTEISGNESVLLKLQAICLCVQDRTS